MAGEEKGRKPSRGKRGSGKGVPRNKRINLAIIGEERVNWALAAVWFVLIVALAAVFSKVLVVDRMSAAGRAAQEANDVDVRLKEVEAEIEAMEGVSGQYHHYSVSGMTEEEKSRARRQDVLRVIDEISSLVDRVESFQTSGNALTVNISAEELRTVSNMIGQLEDNPLVDTISISIAQTESDRNVPSETGDEAVKATISIYMTGRKSAT